MTLLAALQKHRLRVLIILLVILSLLLVWTLIPTEEWSWDRFIDYGKSLPAIWFIAAFFILPLVGAPISALLVLAGIRFGFLGGMALTTFGIFFHNFIAYHITHGLFRTWVRDRLQRTGYAIPPIKKQHRVWFTSLFVAIHGPPYWAKLYLLALTDLPFRIYFWIGAPVYILFCLVPVAAGGAATELNPVWIYALIGAFLVVFVGGIWLRRRYSEQLKL